MIKIKYVTLMVMLVGCVVACNPEKEKIKLKDVYRDHNHTIKYEQPIALDGNGKARVYGKGSYRIVVLSERGKILFERDMKRDTNHRFKFNDINRDGLRHNGFAVSNGKVYFLEIIKK